MIVEFTQPYLEDLYETGKTSDKKHRFQPQVIQKYQKRIDTLIGATCKEDLFPIKSLGFEALRGDKVGFFSIKVDMQYRIEFSIIERRGESIASICYIEELSNHYT